MVTLQKNEKNKNHTNRVKITLKTSENYSKRAKCTSFREITEQLFCFTFFTRKRVVAMFIFINIPIFCFACYFRLQPNFAYIDNFHITTLLKSE